MTVATKARRAKAKRSVNSIAALPKPGKQCSAKELMKPKACSPNGNGKATRVVQPTELPPSVPENNGAAKKGLKPIGALPTPETNGAAGTNPNLSPNAGMSPVAALSVQLVNLQRKRSVILKSRNMQANRLQAIVAGTLGYSSGMPEKERRAKFVEAGKLVKAVAVGKADHPMKEVILVTLTGINAFNNLKDLLEKEMVAAAKQLPVAAWVGRPEQRGFGLLFLAIVVGETGDLFSYANPGKLWRRLGCAPWEFGGKMQMGASWRSGKNGKLPAEEWAKFGYNPRRRSIAYLIGEGIVKQNSLSSDSTTNHVGGSKNETENRIADVDEFGADGDLVDETEAAVAVGAGGERAIETEIRSASRVPGPYRQRYDETKARFKETHPDESDLHAHRHGMLLATKRLLRELWIEWWKHR